MVLTLAGQSALAQPTETAEPSAPLEPGESQPNEVERTEPAEEDAVDDLVEPAPLAPADDSDLLGPLPPVGTGEPSEVDEAVEGSEQGGGLFEQSLRGGELDAPLADQLDPAGLAFDLNGYVRSDMFIGSVPPRDRVGLSAAYGELSLKLKISKAELGAAFAEPRFRFGQQGRVRDLFIELREAYVDFYLGSVDLRLGQQIFVWGRADAFNPTNNLLPFDLRIRSPLEDDRRVGNIGARAFLNLAPVRLEGVWLPLYTPVEFPPIETGEFISLSEPDFPDPELENGLYALRVHLELPEFEASASYLYGYAPLPGLALGGYTVGVEPPEIRIARTAYDQHVVGFDFSTALGELLALRGEAAYRRPVDYIHRVYAPRRELQYVLGADRSFGPVSIIAQYLGRYVFRWQRESGPEDPLDPEVLSDFDPPLPPLLSQQIEASINQELARRNQILFGQIERVQHLASARIEWLTLHDTLSLSALGLYNFSTREWLLYPKIAYQLADGLSATLGGEIYVGPSNTLLDLIDEQLTAGYAELRASF